MRLTPDKVKANLVAQQANIDQQVKIGRPHVSKQVMKIAKQAFAVAATETEDKIQTGVLAAAENNPFYRPFIGKDWKETYRRFYEHTETLPEAQGKELKRQFLSDCHLSGEDFFGVAILALAISGEGSGAEAEPPSA